MIGLEPLPCGTDLRAAEDALALGRQQALERVGVEQTELERELPESSVPPATLLAQDPSHLARWIRHVPSTRAPRTRWNRSWHATVRQEWLGRIRTREP